MKKAKLFQNGQSQAVRLPREFRFKGKEVFVKRAGNALLLIPMEGCWELLVDSLEMFSTDFMNERSQPETRQDREELFR